MNTIKKALAVSVFSLVYIRQVPKPGQAARTGKVLKLMV